MRVVAILILNSELDDLGAVAEACMRWSPQVALGEKSILIEIGRCAKLYSEETVLLGLMELLKGFGLQARFAVGDDIPTALSMARYGSSSKDNLPVDALNEFLNPFHSTNELNTMVEQLKRLGLRQLNDFSKLTPREISTRFGKKGLFAMLRVKDARHIVWPHFKPKEVIEEKQAMQADQPIKNLEPVLFILKNLFDRTVARLLGRSEKVTKFQVTLEQENYSTVNSPMSSYNIELVRPQNSSADLLSIVKERLSKELQQNPLRAPLVSIELRATETVAGVSPQSNFFDKREEQQEALATLVNRLCQRLGESKSFWAQPVESYRPEKTWVRTLSQTDEFTLPFPQRPLRILKEPQRVRRLGNVLQYRGHRWSVENFEGPENLSGEWWGDFYERNYYRVATTSGEELWLFKENQDLYLHGIFD